MKTYIVLLLLSISSLINAQEPTTNKAKDSIKTEVVEVVTSYAPKVTDAFKIKRKPAISLSKNVQKQSLSYSIKSVPVASTFLPASGTIKGIDVGQKEVLFDNYLSVGFGNNISPLFEVFMHHVTPFESEYGMNLKVNSVSDPAENTELSSSFYTIDLGLFLKQEDRYLDWSIGLNAQRRKNNWYGLPNTIDFNEFVINSIEPEQIYKTYEIFGDVEFEDSYIHDISAKISYFSDIFDSSEIDARVSSKLSFPLGRFGLNLEDLDIHTGINYLSGSFSRGYANTPKLKHGFITANIHPEYTFGFYDFTIKLGAKAYFTMDIERSVHQFLAYPDIDISYPIIPKYANIYVGASGDLQTNSFQSLSEANDFVSPTLNIFQTDQQYQAYGGLKGVLSGQLNYNVKGSFTSERTKPLFFSNLSRSNGITTAEQGGFSFQPYEYGNSFDVVYDSVKTMSALGEIEYTYNKQMSFGFKGEFFSYSLSNELEAWNLPTMKADLFGKYKTEQWFAGVNIYFMGSRKGFLQTENTTVDLDSFVDINLNGGYHFNDMLSFFVKANNVTNSTYQNFTNFNAQGLQVLGGVIWKFDSLFQ